MIVLFDYSINPQYIHSLVTEGPAEPQLTLMVDGESYNYPPSDPSYLYWLKVNSTDEPVTIFVNISTVSKPECNITMYVEEDRTIEGTGECFTGICPEERRCNFTEELVVTIGHTLRTEIFYNNELLWTYRVLICKIILQYLSFLRDIVF